MDCGCDGDGGLDAGLDGHGLCGIVDGNDSGLIDGDAGGLANGFGGSVSVASFAFDGGEIDAVDLLGCDVDHAPGDYCQGPEGTTSGVARRGDDFGFRVVSHAEASLLRLFSAAAEGYGLLRVPSILIGQKALERTDNKLLPVNAWAGVNTGNMPTSYRQGMTGTTSMWRYFFQVPKRDWAWSKPEYDREACVYMDVSGMTWHFRELGDYESQLRVRVIALKSLDHTGKRYCFRPGPLKTHRRAAESVNKTVHDRLCLYTPAAKSVEKRRAILGPAPQVVTKPAVPATAPAARSGDLLATIRRAQPRLVPVGFVATGLPIPSTPPAAVVEQEQVTVTVRLPRRQVLATC